jgi:Family of unknown function (DUF6662)
MRSPLARSFTAALVALGAALVAAPSSADEPLFGFTYTTDLLPKGQKEIEQWVSLRHGKAGGTFRQWEERTEFSYGVTDRFQLSVYGNWAQMRARHNGVDGATAPSETFAERQPGVDDYLKAGKYIGTSVEGIYRIWSPYIDPVGLALYVEPTFGRGLRELESKVIVQKNFLDDRLVLAANLTVAQEGRYLPADPGAAPGSDEASAHWDHETDLNLNLAASYRFAPKWFAGVEFTNEREFSSFRIARRFRTNNAYYFGPTLHYGDKNFFVTVTYLGQLAGARDYANPPPGFIVGGRTYADDFERYRLRIKAGFYF